jgi:hypothetical protein
VTDVLPGVNSFMEDEFTSPSESKPKAAAAQPKSTTCHYCSETFEGQWGSARRGMHEKSKHPDEWAKAKATGVKPKKATAKKAPAAKKAAATGPVGAAKARRIPAGDTISSTLAMAAQLVIKVDGPTGRALSFSAPAAGEAVDDLVAGTVVDRLVIQKFAGAADKWEKVGGIIAFPVLIAVISRNPNLFQPLEAQLRSATVDVINASIPSLKKKAASEKKAAESLSELGKIDPRYLTDDPIKMILEDIFGAHIVSPTEGDGETQ